MARDVRLIAAVGKRGQLGLDGRLPWHDPADLKRFAEVTTGGVLIFGARTFRALPITIEWDEPKGAGHMGRDRIAICYLGRPPLAVLSAISIHWPDRPVWICGGAHTYRAFLPFVRTMDITRIDYDGPADAWMPQLWESAP